jgi:hypothetical protein
LNIKFSRHSKRRINLYNIREEDVINEIDKFLSNSNFKDGKMELIEKISTKNKFPLKIVFEKLKTEVIVITVYPLKKGKK